MLPFLAFRRIFFFFFGGSYVVRVAHKVLIDDSSTV